MSAWSWFLSQRPDVFRHEEQPPEKAQTLYSLLYELLGDRKNKEQGKNGKEQIKS